MDKAFCTFYSFLLGDLEPFELKTAALWFNTILIDVPDQKLWEERNNLFLQNSGLDAQGRDELSRIFQSSTTYFPRCSLAHIDPGQRQIIHSAYQASEVELYRAFQKRMGQNSQHQRVGDVFVRWTLDSSEVAVEKMESLSTWANAQAYFSAPLFATPVEHGLLRRLVGVASGLGSADILQTFGALNIPNFASMPWTKILELRHNPRWNNFREKMSQLAEEASKNEVKSVKEIIEEAKSTDLWALASFAEPNPIVLTIKAIVGLLSQSPLGSIQDFLDIVKAYKHDKKFGWLYFVRDLGGK